MSGRIVAAAALFGAASLSLLACGGRPETSPRVAHVEIGDHETGYASWYGPDYHGNQTASGERYNMFDLTAAHRTWPFGTRVRVQNLENGKSVVVRINDRGPFVRGRILDLSYRAAREIECSRDGSAKVRIEVVELADARASEGVDPEHALKDAVGVVPLAEQCSLGIVDLHVRQGGDPVLP
ncbi:MAG TPA: septal ring lytic transglycosylase RlpA family protein, partial [Verrucomicrobiae bacterium]|nr:septal ring lytic transglycosylase RlpA family protein [Verrucomicrobiae bacterium]